MKKRTRYKMCFITPEQMAISQAMDNHFASENCCGVLQVIKICDDYIDADETYQLVCNICHRIFQEDNYEA